MTVLRKRPGEAWEFTKVEDELEALQAEVDGRIETVTFQFPPVTVIVNEEGRLDGLPENVMLNGEMLVGTVLVAGHEGDELCDIPAVGVAGIPQIFQAKNGVWNK